VVAVTTPSPIALVVDRVTAEKVSISIGALGGAWVEMFDTWRRSGFAYLVLMAHTPERLRKRAPLTLMVDTDEKLRDALKLCCSQLNDVKCQWLLCVEAGSSAEAITREEILKDAVAGGTS
jgi:hypothetical protein